MGKSICLTRFLEYIFMKKFNYTYITTNLKNGKKYVGDHSTDMELKTFYKLGYINYK